MKFQFPIHPVHINFVAPRKSSAHLRLHVMFVLRISMFVTTRPRKQKKVIFQPVSDILHVVEPPIANANDYLVLITLKKKLSNTSTLFTRCQHSKASTHELAKHNQFIELLNSPIGKHALIRFRRKK